jgi:SAM-dependent methyltransferase
LIQEINLPRQIVFTGRVDLHAEHGAAMVSVEEHYESLLAPVYLWMAGGIDHALSQGLSDLEGLPDGVGMAVDLGAGFGMHAIPLARSGYRVLAIDSSQHLLEQLESQASGLPIRTICADLLGFREHLVEKAQLIICMGDTLMHLEGKGDVVRLFEAVADALAPGGRFIATFRDYTRLPQGVGRFVPVRSDSDRIHTCFLEELPEHVAVHDLIHERGDDGWFMKVSSYRKLRLAPGAVRDALSAAGLETVIEPGPRGMVKITAGALPGFGR